MQRREFLTHALTAAAVLAVAPTLLSGCDEGEATDTDIDTNDDDTGEVDTGDADTDDVDTDDAGADCVDCTDSVAEGPSDFHDHFICLTQADLDSTSDITYTSEGGSHPHTFTITSAQLADIAAGNEVTIQSNDTHAHSWVVSAC